MKKSRIKKHIEVGLVLKLVERLRQWCNQILDLMLGCEFMDFFISTLCRFNHRYWWNYFLCAGHGFGAEKAVCTAQGSLPSQKRMDYTVNYFTSACKIATSIICRLWSNTSGHVGQQYWCHLACLLTLGFWQQTGRKVGVYVSNSILLRVLFFCVSRRLTPPMTTMSIMMVFGRPTCWA
jgi:hypothetical protein